MVMGLAMQNWAAPVGRTQALRNAQVFLLQRGLTQQPRLQYKAPRHAQAQDDVAAYYIFNVGDNQGFVVVSGDDRTEQILGYTDKGAFDEAKMPTNMRAWLQSYADQIQALDRQGVTTAQRAPRRSQATRAVTPMLTTTWDQGTPYNQQCPEFFSGLQSVTGCVATAMAQILYYHREESKAAGVTKLQNDLEAYQCDTKWGSNGYVSVQAFSAADSKLDWDNMLDSYNGSATQEQQDAVAYLMAYCGSAVKMDYADEYNGGSSGSDSDVPDALKRYFGYDEAMSLKSRTDYTIAGWENLILGELYAGRPVFYGGSSSGGGHAFVVDGYDGDGLFHINWGWSGESDGYFLLSVCNPDNNSGIGASSSSDGYTLFQDAVIGCQPQSSEPLTIETALTGTIYEVSGNEISYYYTNNTGQDNKFNCGIGYVDAAGQSHLLQMWAYAANQLPPGYYTYPVAYTLSAEDFEAQGLPTGRYRLVPLSQVGDDGEWELCQIEIGEIEGDYNAEAHTLTINYHAPVFSLAATDLTFNGPHIAGVSLPVGMTITNNGDECNSILFLFASTTSDKGSIAGVTGITLAEGESTSVEMSFTPSSAGKYTIWITTDMEGNNVIATGTVTVVKGSLEKSLTLADVNVYNSVPYAEGVDVVIGNLLAGTLTISNTGSSSYVGDVEVVLWDLVESTYSSTSSFLNVASGATAEIPFDYRNLKNDGNYFIALYYPDENSPFAYSNEFYILPAGMMMLNDGTTLITLPDESGSLEVPDNAVSVDMTGIASEIITITPCANPNTLYIIGESETLPAGLTGKNIVKGTHAETITLTDGYDFMTPKTITADRAVYNRTFTKGTNGQGAGWKTLVLPFAPTSVSQGAKQLDWFHSGADQDKNFWLMEFSKTEDSKVYFDYAPSLYANTPYIIAVPDATWGTDWDLRNKVITFAADDVTFRADAIPQVASDAFKFVGIMQQKTLASAYLLNNEGSRFSLEGSVEHPFRAYFVAKSSDSSLPHALSIGFLDDTSTAITLPAFVSGQAAVYNLQGVRVAIVPVAAGQADLSTLPKGVYIVNGKKVIK